MVSHYDAQSPKQWAPLTAREELFVKEYLVDLNIKNASERSGIVRQRGDEILKHPKVIDAVRIEMYKRSIKAGITADNVLIELYKIANSDATDAYETNQRGEIVLKELKTLPEELRKSIKSIDHTPICSKDGLYTGYYRTKVQFYDKIRALELLGKHLNLFGETAPVNTPTVNPLLNAFKNSINQVWKD